MVCSSQTNPLPVAGSCTAILEHEGREADNLVTPETSERKQKDSLCVAFMQMLTPSKILIFLLCVDDIKQTPLCMYLYP